MATPNQSQKTKIPGNHNSRNSNVHNYYFDNFTFLERTTGARKGVSMAGIHEDANFRKSAEEIAQVVRNFFPDKFVGVSYEERDGLFDLDTHYVSVYSKNPLFRLLDTVLDFFTYRKVIVMLQHNGVGLQCVSVHNISDVNTKQALMTEINKAGY